MIYTYIDCSKDYYGDHWASANLENVNKITSICDLTNNSEESCKGLLEEAEILLCLGNSKCNLKDVEIKWHLE